MKKLGLRSAAPVDFRRDTSTPTSLRRTAIKFSCLALIIFLAATQSGRAADVLWSSAGGSAWLTGTNWTGGAVPANTDVAQFGGNPTGTNGIGINFNGTTNAGTQTNGSKVEDIGAVEITSARNGVNNILIGNSSTTAGATGKFRLRGATVNGVADVIIRNNSDKLLTIQNNQGTGNQGMTVQLGDATNNIINIDSTGGVTISAPVSDDPNTAGARNLTLNGVVGGGVLTLGGTNTYTGKTTLNTNAVLNVFGGNVATHLGNGTGADAVTINSGTLRTANTSSVTSPSTRGVTVNTAATFDLSGGGTVFWAGSVNGSGMITKAGSGILSFTGTNNYTGKYTVTNGELNGNNTDLGFGPVPSSPVADYFTLNGGLLRSSASYSIDSNRGITLGVAGGGFDNATAGTLTYNGVISGGPGTGGFTKSGTQTTALGGANTFTGTTRSAAGTLVLANSLALQNSTLDMNTADAGAVSFDSSITAATLGGLTGSRNLSLQNSASTAVALSVGNNNTSPAAYSGALSGSGSLTKVGTGTLQLDGTNTYAGTTTVATNGGTLKVNGSITGTGAVTINSGGTLAGTGSIAGPVTVAGTLSPGASIETVTVGSPLTLNSGSTTISEVDTAASLAAAADLINVSGLGVLSISTGASLNITHVAGTPVHLPLNTKLTLVSYTTLDTSAGFGNFAGKPDGHVFTLGQNEWQLVYQDNVASSNFNAEAIGNGNKFVTITVVPEASGVVLGSLVCLIIGAVVGGRKLLKCHAAA